ncbi:potassium-transporting ATPase subunit C [uncultured Enterococcus sp.]|uniref:potassium-transporting ATPase subunit C n=1 Tax=uncultured Enterococcus sp. TaxID=167972 RepID=UPI0025D6408B|nr:potassium-transporting ATPase subunit C [uncultured Enterococcus sp.]
MKKEIMSSLRFLIFSVMLFGGVYTLLVTGVGQLLFHTQANGSQIVVGDQVVGSKLIGQTFEEDRYFSGRSQEVSQLAPSSATQEEIVTNRTKKELLKNPSETKVPIDLVTASASGVDPDISLEAATFQIERIAKIRNLAPSEILQLIKSNQEHDWFSNRTFVNVLRLNIALNQLDQ